MLLLLMPILWLWPMPLPLCAGARVGTSASKNKVRNRVATLFIAFTSNEIEACDSDPLPVRLHLSHASTVIHVTTAVRSAVHIVPVAMHIHPVAVMAAP